MPSLFIENVCKTTKSRSSVTQRREPQRTNHFMSNMLKKQSSNTTKLNWHKTCYFTFGIKKCHVFFQHSMSLFQNRTSWKVAVVNAFLKVQFFASLPILQFSIFLCVVCSLRGWQATRVQFVLDLWKSQVFIIIKRDEIWVYFALLPKMNLFLLNQVRSIIY